MPKNTTQCPRPGLEPGPINPQSSSLTTRPPRLPQKTKTRVQFSFQLQQYLLFPVLFRPGNGTRAFCWTNEDREALAEVSIILAADGRG